MRTATVRDLRNRYTSLLSWIGAGEEIVITQRGKPIARLIPERAPAVAGVDWSRSPALMRDRSTERRLTEPESSAILRESSSQW